MIFINFPNHIGSEIALNSIKGGAKAYKHLMIQFADTLFSKSKLDLLIECLKRFYHAEGFRPYGDLWTESYIGPVGGEKFGFQGVLVNCSDEEYIKICQYERPIIGKRPKLTHKKLIQHFI